MAVKFGTAEGYLYRSATLPTFPSITMTGWARYKGTANEIQPISGIIGATSPTTNFINHILTGTNVCINVGNTATGTFEERATWPSVNDWCFWVMTHDASHHGSGDLVIGAESITMVGQTETESWASSAWSMITLGGYECSSGTSSYYFSNFAVADVKLWTAVLTQGQIEAEQFKKAPQHLTDLWAYWPLDVYTDLTDYGDDYGAAGGRDLTGVGTFSTESADPPWTSAGTPGSIVSTITL